MNSHWKTFNIRIRINEAEVGDGESWIMSEMAAGAEEHIIITEAHEVPTAPITERHYPHQRKD